MLNNLFKVTQYLDSNWTHCHLYSTNTTKRFCRPKKGLTTLSSHGQGSLTATHTVTISPSVSAFSCRIQEKSSPALSLIFCKQTQKANSVIRPSAWVCTFNPRLLSLPLIFFSAVFLESFHFSALPDGYFAGAWSIMQPFLSNLWRLTCHTVGFFNFLEQG